MNKIIKMGCLAAMFAAVSCQKENINYVHVEVGDEVSFGASRNSDMINNVDSRTIYGPEGEDKNGKYQEIQWATGDEIAIFCPQASQPKTHVNYRVEPDAADPTHSSTVTKVNPGDVGIQWGPDKVHDFYAFYPGGNSQYLDKIDHGHIYATIPMEQNPLKWTYDEQSKTWIGEPDMNLAFMYAKKSVDKDTLQNKDIPLEFEPLVTVLEITLNGPSDNSGLPDMTLTNINVNAVEGNNRVIAGQFKCNLRNAEGGHGQCEPIDDGTSVRNRISISCWNSDPDGNPQTQDGEFIVLKKGEKMKVKAFLIPDDSEGSEIQPHELQVSVSPLCGANFVKNLVSNPIIPHKINRVTLPYLTTPGTNYWMSSLDPNVYVTELSIPGSKFSALSPSYGGNLYYQTTSIDDQFKIGNRAFIIQTGVDAEHKIFDGAYDGLKEVYVARDETRTDVKLKTALLEVVNGLKGAMTAGKKNEFAVVILTYSNGATSSGGIDVATGVQKPKTWIQGIRDVLKKYRTDADLGQYIYNGDITPETTIADVNGKILFKVNVNDISGSNMTGVTISDTPAMFAKWIGIYSEDAGMPLFWKNYTNINDPAASMRWMYQEATHVRSRTSGTDEVSYDDKLTSIKRLFDASLANYQQNTHNTWYMNDLGGDYLKTSTQAAVDLSKLLHPYFIDLIQTRTENASLGFILMNFADDMPRKSGDIGYGKSVKSPELIQTVIDNNFKFTLRKKPSSYSAPASRSTVKNSDPNQWDE